MTSLSTLCYIEKDGQYLMLHRTVKKNDVNKDKWIGVGGHFEADESPEECVLREVKEETGYTLTSYRFRGIVTFVSGNGVTEYMHLFTADEFEGKPIACDEGELEWVKKEDVLKLNIWEGDRIFLRLLADEEPFFSLKLVYDGHDTLVSAVLNGKPMELFDILNPDGSKTGIVRERVVAHREGSLHATVHMWIVRPNEKSGYDVLLQKRSQTKDSNPGSYDISSAGHVDAGDEILESAIRELKEELDIEAKPEELHYIGVHYGAFEAEFYGKMFRDRELSSVYVYTEPVEMDCVDGDDYDGIFLESLVLMDANFLYRYLDKLLEKSPHPYGYHDEWIERLSHIWKKDTYLLDMDSISNYIYEKAEEKQWTYRPIIGQLLCHESGENEITERQGKWIQHTIGNYCLDSERMCHLFGAIAEHDVNQKREALKEFLRCNSEYAVFEKLPLESSSWSWSGSEVPVIERRIEYFKSLLPLMSGVKYLKHRQKIETRIENLENHIKYVEVQELLEAFG